jgi:hypothetical protein
VDNEFIVEVAIYWGENDIRIELADALPVGFRVGGGVFFEFLLPIFNSVRSALGFLGKHVCEGADGEFV